MNKTQTFEQFLATSSVELPIAAFLLNFIIAAVLATLLSIVYTRYGNALSNRRAFGRTFVLIAVTTMFIITVVKSSLALSLGLVGALSIVRFRTAIKEPEELAYMFLCIAIGLGLGADQRGITIVAFVAILCLILGRRFFSKGSKTDANLYLTVNGKADSALDLESIVSILREHSVALEMKRFDENAEVKEAAFLIEFKDFDNLNRAKEALKAKDSSARISILENLGAFM